MSRGRGQTFWYIIGGLLLILSGVFALLGVATPGVLGILLIIVGVAVVVASFRRYVPPPPTLPSFAVFLSGLLLFGAVCSGYNLVSPGQMTEVYELTTAQFEVTDLNLTCVVTTGNVRLSFITDGTIVCRVVFTWSYFQWFLRPEIKFKNRTIDEHLYVDASTTMANVDITVGSHLKSSLNLATITGNIYVDAPPNSKLKKVTLTATTGNVEAYFSNPKGLERLQVTTTTGNSKLSMEASTLIEDCAVQVGTATGNVEVDLSLGGTVGCDLNASTGLGRVEANLQGFVVLEKTDQYCHVQTENYSQSSRKLLVTTKANLGNINVNARK